MTTASINFKVDAKTKGFEVTYYKTGALLRYACIAGGILSDASDKQLELLRKYGENFGLNFLSDVITSVYYITMYYIAM